jgi:hypothetical protein
LLSVAVLASAPFVVVPLIVAVCVGMPMVATWALYDAAATTGVRAETATMSRQDRRAIEQLRRKLAHLPETDHPLGC